MLFGFFPFLYCVMEHFCACKKVCKVKKSTVHAEGSYCLPQKTLLLVAGVISIHKFIIKHLHLRCLAEVFVQSDLQ